MKTTDYNAIFPTRLRELMDTTRTTQRNLAEAVKKRPQTVSLWALGETLPDADSLGRIADYFEVSADYLLGRSDVRSPDVDIKAVCEFTGLAEGTVHQLAGDLGKYISPLIDDILGPKCSNFIPTYVLLCAISSKYEPVRTEVDMEDILRQMAVERELDEYGKISMTKPEFMRYLTAEIGNAICEGLRRKYIPGYDTATNSVTGGKDSGID